MEEEIEPEVTILPEEEEEQEEEGPITTLGNETETEVPEPPKNPEPLRTQGERIFLSWPNAFQIEIQSSVYPVDVLINIAIETHSYFKNNNGQSKMPLGV